MKIQINKNLFSRYLLYSIILLSFSFLFSCTSVKNLKYLQSDDFAQEVINVKKDPYKLQVGDNLYIDIITSNLEFRKFLTSGETSIRGSMSRESIYITSYQIDENGYLTLPFISPVKANGKTISELKNELELAFSEYITDVSINLKLVNFNVVVLGEVLRPGQYFAIDNRLNLFEAIGMAGDINIYGDRKAVKVLRLLDNGDYQLRELDITQANVMNDEFFILQPNDIVYIEPRPTKPFGFGTINPSTILSAITTVVVVLNFVLN